MKKFYFVLQAIALCFLIPQKIKSQDCSTLTATCTSKESRCAATGSIKVLASGGSGNYKYKTLGPVNSNYTTSDSITGLSAGVYDVIITDIVTNCSYTRPNVVVNGSYQDPRFSLNKVDVSCDNGSNGSISITGLQFGRAPFQYTIISPSTSNIGNTNTSGTFNNLPAGSYFVQLTDSCGGIQTRQVFINDYSWWIDAYSFIKKGCDSATGFIKVMDSKGNISTVNGIPGFTYGIVRTPGDTIWSSSPNFSFALAAQTNFQVIAKDACGIIKKAAVQLITRPAVGASVTTFNFLCNSFSAEVNNVINFINPEFCIYNSSNVLLSCNNTGRFTNLPYGSYCIKAKDSCTDTTITRCINVLPPNISIGNNVLISNKTCTVFTATISGQSGLTNPVYCLFNAANVQIVCNSSGSFTNLSYGTYCIKTTDGCRDTTIIRCFTVTRPRPVITAITTNYITCRNFGIFVDGDSLSGPRYCLYDTSGALISCNNTGIFDSIPLGNYCVNLYDSCYDTTIIRCFTTLPPVLTNDLSVNITNKACSTFTATATSINLINPSYCLYSASNVLIACDSSGVFTNLVYGSYCIRAQNTCPDTTMIKCFSVSAPVPSIDADVDISNLACSTFSVSVSGQVNLTTPQYCLYNSLDSLVGCNTDGRFGNLSYGSYCMKIVNRCYDTTITRCFTQLRLPGNISGSSNKSCTYGFAKFDLSVTDIYIPIHIKIYKPDGSLLRSSTHNSNPISIDSIPGLPAGQFYKIVAYDNCNNIDSMNLNSTASYFLHTPVTTGKCPGGAWANGSANLQTTVSTNMSSVTVRIIKKDGVTYSPILQPNAISGGTYTFQDLGPGTYIVRYSEAYCNKYLYDTVVVHPYQYPNLSRSSAYQCDVNGFSVSAVATNGVGPFTYEIIGSVPATPSIISGVQTSPIFNINTGATYSLIRLRALDACGNATLGDASILPLANNGIVATQNCFQAATTLSVDSIFNSTYTWWKRTSPTDSTLISSGTSYYLPQVMPTDTGWYVCNVVVNSGCINRTYLYHLNAACSGTLPVRIEHFYGQVAGKTNVLEWKASNEERLNAYILERKNTNGNFTTVARLNAQGTAGLHNYTYTDTEPFAGKNYYRLKLISKDQALKFSNIVLLNQASEKILFSISPNPVKDLLTIECNTNGNHRYVVSLLNAARQVVFETKMKFNSGGKIQIPSSNFTKGMLILKIVDLDSKEEFTERLIFF